MPRKSLWIVLILLLSLTGRADAPRPPRGLDLGVEPLDDGAAILLPSPDILRLMTEDAAAGRHVPLRVGVPLTLALPLSGAARTEERPDGGRLWRLSVRSPGALWLSFVFSDVELPDGVSLYVYGPGGTPALGPFTASENRESRILATPVLVGNSAVIEVDLAPGAAAPPLRLDTVITGYRPLALGELRSGDCEVDVNCPEGADWQDDKRAVAMIYFPPGYLCTGTLLNNVRGDCKDYFLTANHCISRAGEAEAAVFYWNYERTGCGEGDGSLQDWQSGAVLRATNPRSDFTLLELAAPPDPGFRSYYAGWSISTDPPQGAVGIHQPDGDVKKISFENDRLSGSNPSFWRVPHWDIGATEGGSSGSGLWTMDHKIIGQLTGGASACGNPKSQMWDEYGKLSVSWATGSSAGSRLRDWLDPDGTGTGAVPGKDGAVCGSSAHTRPVTHP